jgi:adenylate kinase
MVGRVVILGAPGAGKGTQARRMARKHSWPHISTGDIFRSHLDHKTAIGQKIESYMRSGQLVPDALACQIVVERLAAPDCAGGYILDGFPRSVPQAESLDRMLSDRHESLDAVILLTVDDDELVERLTARWTCPHCGKIYNGKFNAPKHEGYCDKPGCEVVRLVQREDDREDTVRRRLKVYHETTEPLIQHYDRQGLLRRVAGGASPEAIEQEIEDVLKVLGAS